MIIDKKDFKKNIYNYVYDETGVNRVKLKLKSNNNGFIRINNIFTVHANETVYFDVNVPQLMDITSYFDEKSDYSILLEPLEKENLIIDEVDFDVDTIVIENKYPMFEYNGYTPDSHLENINFKESNKLFVFNFSNSWYESYYERDGIGIITGNIITLKNIFLAKKFNKIINKVIDSDILWILYSYTNQNQNKCFISYGYEEKLVNNRLYNNRYFFEGKEKINDPLYNEIMNRYVNDDSILWIMKNERAYNYYKNNYNKEFNILKYKYSNNISFNNDSNNNVILLNTSFNDNKDYMCDISLLIIKELLNKESMKKYEFHIIGDGDFKNELLSILPKSSNLYIHNDLINEKDLKVCLELNLKRKYGSNEYKKYPMVVFESMLDVDKQNKNIIVDSNYIDAANRIENFLVNSDEIINIKEKEDVFDNSIINEFLNSNNKKTHKLIAKDPILSIVIPCYNIETYLPKCLDSLVQTKNVDLCEIIVVNDGSKDNTLKVARSYEEKYPGIIKVIDKENGGHGSGVNMGMKLATGKYFRILDSDDWFDTKNFEIFLNKLTKEDADLVLTRVRVEYYNTMDLPMQVDFERLKFDVLYRFDDLLNKNYGITSGYLFAASCYKTELLRKANFEITEKKLYADHEFDAFSIKCLNTVKFYDLDLYMYLIGREGQSVSLDVWQKKYVHHQSAMLTVIEKLENDKSFESSKRYYAVHFVIMPMIIHQINSLFCMNKIDEIKPLINKARKYKNTYKLLDEEVKKNYFDLYNCYFIEDKKIEKAKKKIKNELSKIKRR